MRPSPPRPRVLVTRMLPGGALDRPAAVADVAVWPDRLPPSSPRPLPTGQIFAAGLDVVEHEPIPPGDELLDLPNCLVLPHVGSATVATRTRMADVAADDVLDVLAGYPLPACINPDVLGLRPRPRPT